jgi:phosphonopyruvate decarboxylase
VIEARDFVEAARARGFQWYAGVPCSYLTAFINYVLQDSSLHYLSMANEGDAVALIAGIALSGDPVRPPPLSGEPPRPRRGVAMMQNSGLGNAVSPLTSLTWTFRLPQLLIVTWRGQPGVPDEPQHELMGAITPRLLENMQIAWELFPTEPAALGAALDRATAHMDETGRPFALLMQKGSVAPYSLGAASARTRGFRPAAIVESRWRGGGARGLPGAAGVAGGLAGTEGVAGGRARAAGVAGGRAGAAGVAGGVAAGQSRPARREILREVIARTPRDSTAVLASTGFCGRELYAIDDRPNHLYMVGSMGCVAALALGLALARPDLRVLALDGDGAALMRLGSLATVGAYGPPNLRHLLLDNGVHDSTGGQATVSPQISFAHIAAACGYASALETDEVDAIADWLDSPPLPGPRFARLMIRPGTAEDLPRPSMSPVDVKMRFMRHFQTIGDR